MNDQDSNDKNIPLNPFEAEEPFIDKIIEDDKTGSIQVTFDDGTIATSHKYAVMGEETAKILNDTKLVANKANKWLKRNVKPGRYVDMSMMLQTSMVLGTVSKMLYHSCLAMSEEETERMMN